MKLLQLFLCLALLTVLLSGCPSYASLVPLDKPNVKVNTAYIGKWMTSDNGIKQENHNEDGYEVTKKDEYWYRVSEISNGNATSQYQMYVTNIAGSDFINLQNLDSMNNGYSFYKLALDKTGKKLVMLPLSNYIKETFTDSKKLNAFVAKNKGLSFFYGDSIVLYKK